MKRIIAMLLAMVMVLSLAACKTENPDNPTKEPSKIENNDVQLDKYSIGLDNNGFYEDYDKYAVTEVNLQTLEVDVEDVLKYITSNGEDVEVKPEDIDAYVYEYANNVVASLGLAARETVEDKYYVSCILEFSFDG